jgi:hypothetical protein
MKTIVRNTLSIFPLSISDRLTEPNMQFGKLHVFLVAVWVATASCVPTQPGLRAGQPGADLEERSISPLVKRAQ